MGRHEDILFKYIETRKHVNQPQKVSEDLYITKFHSLYLSDYIIACSMVCKAEHSPSCTECPSMLLIAESVKNSGHSKLSTSFKAAFPSLPYKVDVARRKVLRMPLVFILAQR